MNDLERTLSLKDTVLLFRKSFRLGEMGDLSPWYYKQDKVASGPQAGLPPSRKAVQTWRLAGQGVPGLPVR